MALGDGAGAAALAAADDGDGDGGDDRGGASGEVPAAAAPKISRYQRWMGKTPRPAP